MTRMKRRDFMGAAAAAPLLVAGCTRKIAREVVVYTPTDEMYSRPILEKFQERTGIEVKMVFDTEASKTTGLITKVIAEKDRPRADVFWNNEVVQTISLKRQGLLEKYVPPASAPFPAKYKDPDGYWTGLAARARAIIYNTDKAKSPPQGLMDFLDEKWIGKAAISNPLFGTVTTHAAALFAYWGAAKAENYFMSLKNNDTAVLPGNSVVRDLVASGEYEVGLTDTDDANGAILDNLAAQWILPDQGPGGMGTLLMPNTVSLVKGGPNPETGKRMIEFLLSPEVEKILAEDRSIQIPLNPEVKGVTLDPRLANLKAMDVDYEKAADALPVAMKFMREKFLKE